ncbi:MAG: PQQ-like beta-propeller repeat protein [Rhodopirellula sp.]|nr:PQQ-like beta-propeller repeat protein [Rhodopirellula sp.]
MRPALLLGMAALLTSQQFQSASANDWPSWRGPHRDGIAVDENGLLSDWPEAGPELKWKIDGLGRGYSSIAIADGRIFTMGKRKDGCELIALNLKDGRELWSAPVGGGDPNCTPTVDGGLVYALGRDGQLVCADVATGKIVWQKSFPKDFGGSMMSGWGYSESPLIDGDRLICTPGAKDAVVVALDKKTGATIWKSAMPDDIGTRGKDGAGYSSIVISHAAGVKQYVQLTGRGVISIDAEDGTQLWSYNRIANGVANISTPLVKGDDVFCSTGYGTGAALLHVSRKGDHLVAEEKYFLDAKKMQNHHGGMIVFGDHIYCGHGHNNGFPLCINFATGKEVWSGGRGPGGGSAAILLADGHLYFRYEDGTMALIEATPEAYQLKGKFKLATNNGKSWPHPVIVDGLLYARDQNSLLCYDIRK